MTGRTETRDAGMTLIETLVVVLLLGLITTVVLSGTRLGNLAWSRVERQTEDRAGLAGVQLLLRHAIGSAYPAFISPDPNNYTVAFAGEPNALAFVAPEPGSQGEGAWAIQRLHVAQQGSSQALFLSWHPDIPAVNGDSSLPDSHVRLLDHVASMRLAYFGALADDEAAAWHDRWTNSDHLPTLIRITLERDNAALPRLSELVVRTRVTASVACAYDAFSRKCHRIP